MQAFPLTLTLALKKQRSPNPQLSVTFRFFPALGLVTAAGARAEQDAVLASLYPGDDGSTLPEGGSPSSGGLEVQQLAGKPYRWDEVRRYKGEQLGRAVQAGLCAMATARGQCCRARSRLLAYLHGCRFSERSALVAAMATPWLYSVQNPADSLWPCLCRWAQHAAGLDLLPPLPPQLYNGASAAGGSLADAAAAVQQYTSERRAAAVLDRLKEAVMQPKK